MSDSATPWTAAHQAPLSFMISQSLLKLMSIESMMPSNHLILCHPLLLLASIFSSIRDFSNELALHIRWSKYWSFSISPSNEYSGLISFRMDWSDLLAAQGDSKESSYGGYFKYPVQNLNLNWDEKIVFRTKERIFGWQGSSFWSLLIKITDFRDQRNSGIPRSAFCISQLQRESHAERYVF